MLTSLLLCSAHYVGNPLSIIILEIKGNDTIPDERLPIKKKNVFLTYHSYKGLIFLFFFYHCLVNVLVKT